jgi:hypothetical protein
MAGLNQRTGGESRSVPDRWADGGGVGVRLARPRRLVYRTPHPSGHAPELMPDDSWRGAASVGPRASRNREKLPKPWSGK